MLQFNPDLILVACGLDAARGDPLVSTITIHSVDTYILNALRVDITLHQQDMLT